MTQRIIDAHVHLDMYSDKAQEQILKELNTFHIDHLISVSNHVSSARTNLQLAHQNQRVKPAIGFHPEQKLPDEEELQQLFSLIDRNKEDITAIGEVGLPYYLRKDAPSLKLQPYVDLLEHFIQIAVKLNKPIILHAIYEDADLACDLLEKYDFHKAHFHWFKGSPATIQRMMNNQYFISVTPDCLYESEIQQLIEQYPLRLMMVETDGPWPFEGIFKDKLTHPKMIHQSMMTISKLKGVALDEVYQQLYQNTIRFYGD
ncbi:TatD family hydrolase [Halobacillus hunanensis]|uniref:TatD family hydrolase n=1 Tax=Halobacillus hunanensis TaxID=578214 RepID=UPI0009A6C105|nr:TatD family hydrolase [Halobacillus hunanensis]